MTWTKLCAAYDIDTSSKKVFDIDGLEILIIKTESGIFAIENICSHEDAELHKGCLNGDEIICPLHAWRFNIQTGSCATNSDFDVPVYPVKLENNEIWVQII